MKKFKRCSTCGKRKLIKHFYQNDNYTTIDKLCPQCKKCAKEYNAAYNKKYPEKRSLYMTNVDLKRRYGLTFTQYNKMALDQNGLCAICKQPETHKNQFGRCKLAVDHDHKTKKVRGLLCYKCNYALSCVNDDPKILQIAIKYLKG